MFEGFAFLWLLGVIVCLVVFVFLVRFLWVVPSSLKTLVFYLENLTEIKEHNIKQFDYFLKLFLDK